MAKTLANRSKVSSPKSGSSGSEKDEASDYSNFHIIFLVESDSHLSPYVYHINDQLDGQFHMINDKMILKTLLSKNPERSEELRSIFKKNSPDNSVQQAQVMMDAIKDELQAMKEKMDAAASTTTVMSGLVKRGKNTKPPADSADSKTFVLISTLYNPHFPRLLISSGVPVQAIVRLVHDKNLSQQEGYKRFYENFVKVHPFRWKLKREPRMDGMCRESTTQFEETIATFWKTLDLLRMKHPLIFRNTIFLDNALPFVELSKNPDRTTMDLYRTSLREDVQCVQLQIWNIGRVHECYEEKLTLQNMRAVKKWEVDALTEYKMSLLRRGSNVPCIVESILQEVVYLRQRIPVKHVAFETFKSTASLNEAPQADKSAAENRKILNLATSFIKMTDKLDDYFCLKRSYTGSRAIYARDEVTLSFLLKEISHKTRETTLQLCRTFVEGLTRDCFTTPDTIVERVKACMNEKLLHSQVYPCDAHGHASLDRKDSSKILVDKKFYLSYYLSMFYVNTLEPLKSMLNADERISRDLLKSDVKVATLDKLPTALSIENHCSLSNDYDANAKFESFHECLRKKELASEQFMQEWEKLMACLDLREQTEDIRKIINAMECTHMESSCASPNYVESFDSNTMVQLVLSHVTSCDRVSATRLPITGDVLLHFTNDCHSTNNWSFVIPTPLGLHDFYHHLMEKSLDEKLLSCLNPPSARSEVPSDPCKSDGSGSEMANAFILPDSIKYEQVMKSVNSIKYMDVENSDENESPEEVAPPLKPLHYKYGFPQLVKSEGSELVHRVGDAITLKIWKSAWTHRNVEDITVACYAKSSNFGIAEAKDHLFEYNVNIDELNSRLVSLDFHILLNSGLRIRFKRNQLLDVTENDSPEFVSNSFPDLVNILQHSKSIESADTLKDLLTVFDAGILFHSSFKTTVFRYFPIISCNNGLMIEVSNETALPFCIQQYYTGCEVLPRLVRRYLLNACVVVSEEDEDDVITMTATGETIITSKSAVESLGDSGGTPCRMITPDGDVYEFRNGTKTLQEHLRKKTTERECFEDNCLVLAREDGLSMTFCEDGTLHVVHADGTRFTTSVSVVETYESDEIDGYVLVNSSVEISHPEYMSVSYTYDLERISIHDSSGFEMSLLTDGRQKIQVDKDIALSTDLEGKFWELTDWCELDNRRVSFALNADGPESKLMTLPVNRLEVDCRGNLRYSDEWGLLDQLSMNAPDENISSSGFFPRLLRNDPLVASYLVVLQQDFSGFQILSHPVMKSILKSVQRENERVVIQELDFVHPYYFKLVLENLSLRNGFKGFVTNPSSSDSARTVSKAAKCRVERLPSTFGPDWAQPFYTGQNNACSRIPTVAYRLFNRINMKKDEILQLFLQCLDEIDSINFKQFEVFEEAMTINAIRLQEDGLAIANRFCLGNIPMSSLSQDDALWLVNDIIARAFQLENVLSKNEETRRMLRFLAKGRDVPNKAEVKKCLNARLRGCTRQKWKSCKSDDLKSKWSKYEE